MRTRVEIDIKARKMWPYPSADDWDRMSALLDVGRWAAVESGQPRINIVQGQVEGTVFWVGEPDLVGTIPPREELRTIPRAEHERNVTEVLNSIAARQHGLDMEASPNPEYMRALGIDPRENQE